MAFQIAVTHNPVQLVCPPAAHPLPAAAAAVRDWAFSGKYFHLGKELWKLAAIQSCQIVTIKMYVLSVALNPS
jgi:hypothetical protein